MNKIRSNQLGFGAVEVLLGLIFLAIVAFTGVYVANNRDTKTEASSSSANSKVVENKPTATGPTASWTKYSDPLGKFDIKFPKTWVTVTNPTACGNTSETGVFLLGANSDSVGKCASENFGQMTVTWRSDRTSCEDLSADAWTQDSKQTVTVSSVAATKISATAKEPGFGLGAVPEGTKTVQYCAIANKKMYIANYLQLTGSPDVLSNFNTMVTKTLKFN